VRATVGAGGGLKAMKKEALADYGKYAGLAFQLVTICWILPRRGTAWKTGG